MIHLSHFSHLSGKDGQDGVPPVFPVASPYGGEGDLGKMAGRRRRGAGSKAREKRSATRQGDEYERKVGAYSKWSQRPLGVRVFDNGYRPQRNPRDLLRRRARTVPPADDQVFLKFRFARLMLCGFTRTSR